jgi:nudix-type nucleoside diphosphatase (YffH/AdpP family)
MMKNIRVVESTLLSDNWYFLRRYRYAFTNERGEEVTQVREAYDRGNGAAILLYNRDKKTVILTRQFRLPTFINGNADGMLIEACAGLLDKDNPEDCIRRETEEETGYVVSEVRKVMEAYMSPGSVTEILYLFVAAYNDSMKQHAGGGLEHEQENIEVLELGFSKALDMIQTGEIRDAKTILLLQYAQIHQLV